MRVFLTAPPSWGGWGGSACAPPNPPLNLPPRWGETFRVALRTGRRSFRTAPLRTPPLCRGFFTPPLCRGFFTPPLCRGGRGGSVRRPEHSTDSAPTPPAAQRGAPPCVGGFPNGAVPAFGGRTDVRVFLTAPPSWGGWGGSACALPNPPLNLPRMGGDFQSCAPHRPTLFPNSPPTQGLFHTPPMQGGQGGSVRR